MLNSGLPHLITNATGDEAQGSISLRTRFWQSVLDDTMYVVAVVAPIVLLPQAYTLYTTKDAAGLSLITWVLLVLINVLWVVYAKVHQERPVLISSLLSGLIELVIVIGIVLYQ